MLGSNFSSADLSGDAANAYGSDVQADNTGTSLSVDQLRSQELFDILNAAGSYFDWDDPAGTDEPANDGYPYLAWQNLKKGDPKGDTDGDDKPDGGDKGDGDKGDKTDPDDSKDEIDDDVPGPDDGKGDSGDADDKGDSGDKGDADDSGDKGDDDKGDVPSPDDGKDDDTGGDSHDTDIDNSGGSDPDKQTGKGSGITNESLEDYTKEKPKKKSVKIDKSKLTHVKAATKTAKESKKSQKKSNKAKKGTSAAKSASNSDTSGTRLVKVSVAAAGKLEAGSANSALGGPVNWALVCLLVCVAAGGGYELVRFKRLQPAKQKTDPQESE